jgi:hypothetical protein
VIIIRVMRGNEDVTDRYFHIGMEGSEPLRVTLSSAGSHLSGSTPAPGQVVVLMDSSSKPFGLRPYMRVSDESGHYDFPAVAPGHWSAYAFSSFSSSFFTWQSDWAANPFEGIPLEIKPDSDLKLDLKSVNSFP